MKTPDEIAAEHIAAQREVMLNLYATKCQSQQQDKYKEPSLGRRAIENVLGWICDMWPVLVCVGLIILCVAGIYFSVKHRETVQMPYAYRAWVKQTGNSNALTYAEWRALVMAGEKSDTIIFIPIVH